MITIRDFTVQGIPVHVIGDECSQEEVEQYVKRGKIGYSYSLESMDITIDGEYADLHYNLKRVPFDRIRRITGYLAHLTGFNRGKQAEEHDRLKHG